MRFSMISLEHVTIPVSVTEIDNGVFEDCDNLKTIFYKAGIGFEGNLYAGNEAKLVPYCKLIKAEGVTILGELFIVSGDEKFYADKIKIRDASGKVVSVEIKVGTFAGFTLMVDGDTFENNFRCRQDKIPAH